MQELQIEAAVYQEAVHKISEHMTKRPHGFYDTDNIWDIYAEQFAPDATPDEIESFVESFPDIRKGQEVARHLLPAHVVQFYGAVAVRATTDNPALQRHSAQKLVEGAKQLPSSIGLSYIPSQLIGYALGGLGAVGETEQAIALAETFAQQGGYSHRQHISNLEQVADAFKNQAVSAATHEDDYWKLSRTALDAYGEAKNLPAKQRAHLNTRSVDAVLRYTMTELYAQADKQKVIDFCEKHALYFELASALNAAGESIPGEILDKAIAIATKQESTPTIKHLAQVCVEQDDEARARRLIKSIPKHNQALYWAELRMNVIRYAAQNGDFDTAIQQTSKLEDEKQFDALHVIHEALLATGDVDTFIAVSNKLVPDKKWSGNFSQDTARMAIRAGDTGRALQLAHEDARAGHKSGWWHLADEYILHHVQSGTPESISITIVCSILESARYDENTDMSFVYTQCFKKLHQAGQFELAKELAHRFQGTPQHLKTFSANLRPLAIKDVIETGDWLRAMHGDHLENPEAGLVQSRYIVLIAGGIHRARTQRKQQITPETEELPKSSVVRYNTI